jgi:hypothetical protein
LYAAARRDSGEPLREKGMFWKSRLDAPVDWKVIRSDGTGFRTVIVPAVSVLVSYIQPFQNGLLLAGARCSWRRKGPEQNALVVDWNGGVERGFTLGDGIKDVRVTVDGEVWASYFDEGVFGNYGWSNPGPPAIGSSGLVRFDSSGKIVFTYDEGAAGTGSICDAYALNLADDGDIWVYFYTEFPIVRIRRGKYRAWKLGVSGASALAARDGQALLFGDYGNRDRGRIVALEGDSARVIEEVRVQSDSGGLERALSYGQGSRLFFLEDRQAFVLDEW